MPFILPDLVIESILRDGIREIKNSLGTQYDKIEDIFSSLRQPYLANDYGAREIDLIKNLIKQTIQITHGWPLTDFKEPRITILLANDTEQEAFAGEGDDVDELDEEIEPAVIVGPMDADSYNPATGEVDVTSSGEDLGNVKNTFLLRDGSGVEFPILGGITNETADKHFFIPKNQTVDLNDISIISPLNFERSIIKGVRTQELISIVISTEQALATKYLYTIIKYILLSKKMEIIRRGLELTTYSGNDFTNFERIPNHVFSRTISFRAGFVEHTWRDSTAQMIDNLGDSAIKVERDLYPREDEEELTIRTVVSED